MKVERSGSQILFGYLPNQTVDISGRVWKVARWNSPLRERVDDETLRRELLRQAGVWEASGRDGGYCNDLRRGFELDVVSLNRSRGVQVEPFPRVWFCRSCRRISDSDGNACRCGERRWAHFQFVAYHDCGMIADPFIPRCPQHQEVRVRFPGSASARDIVFDCPVCSREVRRGLGFRACDCGSGQVQHNVHRAASVYTPRSVVIVNAPRPEAVRDLQRAGGASRAVQWILDGLATPSFRDFALTRDALLEQLRDQGLPEVVANAMADQAVASGAVQDSGSAQTPADLSEDARSEAVSIAVALADSRLTTSQMFDRSPVGTTRRDLYGEVYPEAMARCGLEAVELVERFPVLTGMYGYTRGDSTPGSSRLVPFRDRRQHSQYRIYAERAETEALYFRLKPERVARWLEQRGHVLGDWQDSRAARLAIIRSAVIPPPGTDPAVPASTGQDLLTLIHSFAHRVIRHGAALAGIDRNALSEYLVPHTGGFFVFAASRGGFVLGGLQALFERDLHLLLDTIAEADHRCPLDPGCKHSGGACAACLHIGEPSCRWFNRFLDRDVMSGPMGYLTNAAHEAMTS